MDSSSKIVFQDARHFQELAEIHASQKNREDPCSGCSNSSISEDADGLLQ